MNKVSSKIFLLTIEEVCDTYRNETVSLGDTVISLHTSSHISHLGWGCILGQPKTQKSPDQLFIFFLGGGGVFLANIKLKVLSPDQLFILGGGGLFLAI